MRATASLAEFRAAPVGRYLVGSGWIHYCVEPRLFGVILWGRPNREGTIALVRSLALELGEEIEPHQSIVDASRVDSVDSEAFDELSRYVHDNQQALENKVTRLALVRPIGLPGAVAAGFYQVTGMPYPVAVVDDLEGAVEGLGLESKLVGTLGRLADESAHLPEPLGPLRAAIIDRLGAPIELADIARQLGLSERSLQRRLRELGTTFQAELMQVRLNAAKRRMLDSDAPLTAIAIDLGFTSLQHFSNQFRKFVGQAPSAWRARNR
ncbi:MAG: AraC family transcriptional regulator [Deltaproteobacteria bacterium]|nr:AraC family transcriptional regulator [Deltaproteobacteria bacterium]